jgi:hypothetical protein
MRINSLLLHLWCSLIVELKDIVNSVYRDDSDALLAPEELHPGDIILPSDHSHALAPPLCQ